MHHLGSGIWSQMRFSTGAIFSVTVPATIIRSDWRGLGRKTSAPKRAISNREVDDAIISIAQQARPKVSGHNDDWIPYILFQIVTHKFPQFLLRNLFIPILKSSEDLLIAFNLT